MKRVIPSPEAEKMLEMMRRRRRDLRVFVDVADAGVYHASRRSGLRHGAVVAIVHQLEELFCMRLVASWGLRVRLTGAGVAFRAVSLVILDATQAIAEGVA